MDGPFRTTQNLNELKMLLLMLCFLFLSCVFGGSPCPPRGEIYPCICIDRSIGKSKFDTTIICQGLANVDSLLAIEPTLSSIEVNTFLLYDSYWPTANAPRLQTEVNIPVNHVSKFRMEEVKVVDTTLSIFGCPSNDNCKTSYLKKFTAINSTVSERSSCNNNGLTVNSWISCPGNIKQLIIDRGLPSDMTLKPDFFPEPMSKLQVLKLPRNNISRIDKRLFNIVKFPMLRTLDLSYNTLRDGKYMFSTPMKLHYLDLSYNSIRTLVDFQQLPDLQTLKLSNNHIVTLLEYEWQHASPSLRHVDLSGNRIDCNCAIKWVNSTFHINADLLGSCISPPEVVTMKLRKASRYFNLRCDEKGNVGPKIKSRGG